MVNKYPGKCHYCKCEVGAGAGNVWKWKGRWYVAHLDCSKNKGSRVIEVRTSGGTFYRNSAGRCEDAPCCGCCTI